ncbi:hypothetical protein AB0H76_33055 [Nocardia sp. NPDC050712]|uniref:hypothetical protein n=1 Tax=Nocardia sp. NPDC050712 TaxID=3155518 RepID=UPI0033F9E2AD
MRTRPTALGYLRRDISGISQTWDEIQIRSRATRLGYDYAKTIVFDLYTPDRLLRLLRAVERADVDAVIIPAASHLGDRVPAELIQRCDVITVNPEFTYARTIAPPLFSGDL